MTLKKSVFSIALFFAAGAAYADDVSFSFDRAALSSFDGVEQLHKEIEATAKASCPRYARVRSLADIRTCRAAVTEALVVEVNDANLTAYHQGQELGVQVVSR